MEYIDKSNANRRDVAHKIIGGFLQRQFDASGRFPTDLYKSFTSDTTCNKPFRDILMNDSDNHCCYCMRKIKAITIEHVILNSTNDQFHYDAYYKIDSELEKDNMQLASTFIANNKQAPPYPHTIAYENLLPSCFGHLASASSKCCNIYRGEKFVHPLTFRKNIHNEIVYYNDGSIEWTKDPNDDPDGILTVTKIGLDCLELTIIRRIWYYLVSHNINVIDADIEDLIYNLLDLSNNDEEDELIVQFKQPDYWKLISEYDYFNNPHIFAKR